MQSIGILGMGLLGRGIAACLLANGYQVTVYSTNTGEYQQAEIAISSALNELSTRGLLAHNRALNWRENIVWASELEPLRACSFVIESILESLSAKIALYERLADIIGPHTPIATNTSSLPIGQLQAGCKHPERLIGMHWAEPAHATRFLEVVCGPQTSASTLEATLQLAATLGKEPCVVHTALPGFIANRLGYALYREALHLLQLGVADAETIDCAFRNSIGLWAASCGPLRWIDLTGGPALYLRAMDNVLPSLSNASSTSELACDSVNGEDKGILNGSGFYNYSAAQAAEWQERFQKHVWTIRALQEEEFPIACSSSGI